MRKLLPILLFLVACGNDAVEYAQALDPSAKCTKLQTSWFRDYRDTAMCRFQGFVWYCEGDRCDQRAPIPAEVAK